MTLGSANIYLFIPGGHNKGYGYTKISLICNYLTPFPFHWRYVLKKKLASLLVYKAVYKWGCSAREDFPTRGSKFFSLTGARNNGKAGKCFQKK